MRLRRIGMTAAAGLLTVPMALGAFAPAAVSTVSTMPVADVAGATPLPATATTSWQTNGPVYGLAYASGRVYLAGQFTKVRPPGVAAGGVGEVAANHIAAFDATTGAFVPTFKHTPNNQIWNLAASPDGKTLYAGGDFTTMDGKARNRVAAFDLTTANGTLNTFAPVITGRIRAISANATAVFLGGTFTAADGQTRTNAAAYTPAGALLPWAPNVDDRISAIQATPQGDKVVLGGDFDHVNGEFHRALGLVDATTGANAPLDDGIIAGDCTNGCTQFSTVRSFTTDGTNVYAGVEGTGYGWFDGTLKLDPTSGHLLWKDNCLGATQAVTVIGGTLYAGSHSHDCADVPGGFPQAPLEKGWHHLISEDADGGTVQPWFPNTNAGPGIDPLNELGPRAMATDGSQLFVGGSFTQVNGVAQQGFTRFQPRTLATDAAPVAPAAPVATSNAKGKALVKFAGSYDLDDGQLTYRLYRDNVLVNTWTAQKARWWFVPQYTFLDSVTGTHSYTVDATDAQGKTSPRSSAGTVTTITTASNGGYPNAVKAQSPTLYWRFEEPAGSTTVADSSGNNHTGTVQRGVTAGVPGVTPGTTAVDVDDAVISLDGPGTAVPTQFAMEAWFKTTSRTGGRIMGFGDSQSGTSTNYDPFVYLDAGGQLIFGQWDNMATFTYNGVWGAKAYNDGTWHHVVASSNGSRLEMYIDGVRQGGGKPTSAVAKSTPSWFRVGTDTFGYWPLPPKTAGFTGSLDDVAVYSTPLTAAQALTHYRRAG
jgi:hypothetical protein